MKRKQASAWMRVSVRVGAFLWVFGVYERGCGWECVKERHKNWEERGETKEVVMAKYTRKGFSYKKTEEEKALDGE